MSAQKLAYIFLIAASIVGLSVIFIKRFSEASCPQNDRNLCSFIKKNKDISKAEIEGTYTYVAEDKALQIDWSKKGDMSTLQINKGKDSILDAIFATRYLYIKDNSDGKWWREEKSKVENTLSELPLYPELFFPKLESLLNDDRTTFTALKDVPCGDSLCLRYKVINPDQKEKDQVFIAFSKEDFKLRSVMLIQAQDRGDMTISYDPVSISEPEDVKIVSAGKNIFLEYMDQRDTKEEKTFDYVEQFQKERLKSEGSTSIEYVENTPTPEPSISP